MLELKTEPYTTNYVAATEESVNYVNFVGVIE